MGQATLPLRAEIAPNSKIVATLNFGERVEILQKRRRFLRLRTRSGAEGWTDERQLVAAADLAELQSLNERAARLPSQGVATTFDVLNVHTLPYRSSPSYLQIREGEKFDVLDQKPTPRTESPVRTPLLPPPPPKKPTPKKSKSEGREEKLPPPPKPAAPKAPENWLELSVPRGEAPQQPEVKPVPTDDWSLIRTRDKRTGWVLTRRIVMAIPDEVAQYAEGRRITSYFSLGQTADGGETKNSWLWTTIERGQQDRQFDSFRVFIWSTRRHRYETAYIERNLAGYFPILIQDVDLSTPPKKRGEAPGKVSYPGFSVLVEKEGRRYRKNYAFLGNVVRFAGQTEVAETAGPAQSPATPRSAEVPLSAPPAPEGFWKRTQARIRAWFSR